MSTWIYLECIAHEPAIQSDQEVGQHLYDLPRIREEIAKRAEYVAAVNLDAQFEGFTRAAATFFAQHPACPIRIVDEYDREYPLEESEAE